MPRLEHFVTVLYRPRQTMRAILDGGRDRWTVPIVILAFLSSAAGDQDIRHAGRVLPDVSLAGLLAMIALVLILIAIIWVLFVYVFAWIVTMVGRWLDGEAAVADVRAALAWGLVPVIWAILFRIPIAVYSSRFELRRVDARAIGDIIAAGGCSIFAIVATLQLLLYVWMAYVVSNTVAEALRFSTWKGLGTLAISMILPFVIALAAILTFH